MARFDRLTVLNEMVASGLVPVFYHSDIETAKRIVAACAQGGAKLIEFTNRGEKALPVFAELVAFAEANFPQLILGTGSIVDAPTAALFIANGSNFIVGPVLNEEVARLCNRRKIPYSPGCGSASEISRAEELGVEIVKIFPGAQVGGPAFVKAVRAPMPWTRIMPTGGVDASEQSIRDWFTAGVSCVGIGSKLIRKEWVAEGKFDNITQTTQNVLAWIAAVKKSAK